MVEKIIKIDANAQSLTTFEDDKSIYTYTISTGKNGLGEQNGSGCTPRGWHQIHSIIGLDAEMNSVFVGREFTGEIYTEALHRQNPDRDWILTRIIRLDGLEIGRNKGGDVDSLLRYIYIHGTPKNTKLGVPGSKGCIRMRNEDICELCKWAVVGTKVLIS